MIIIIIIKITTTISQPHLQQYLSPLPQKIQVIGNMKPKQRNILSKHSIRVTIPQNTHHLAFLILLSLFPPLDRREGGRPHPTAASRHRPTLLRPQHVHHPHRPRGEAGWATLPRTLHWEQNCELTCLPACLLSHFFFSLSFINSFICVYVCVLVCRYEYVCVYACVYVSMCW